MPYDCTVQQKKYFVSLTMVFASLVNQTVCAFTEYGLVHETRCLLCEMSSILYHTIHCAVRTVLWRVVLIMYVKLLQASGCSHAENDTGDRKGMPSINIIIIAVVGTFLHPGDTAGKRKCVKCISITSGYHTLQTEAV